MKPSRPRRGWHRIAPILRYFPVVLIAGYCVYVGSKSVAQAHVLRIERISVRGNERLSEGEVLAVLSGLRGESLVWADLERWRERLLASPWIRDASFRRSLPSTVEVVVLEREPVGIGRLSGGIYLVDERGTIIDAFGPQYAEFDLPIIDGLAPPVRSGSAVADPLRAQLAARVIGALGANPDVARRLSQIDVTDRYNARVILDGDPAVISLGNDRFLERLQGYLEMAPTLRERVQGIDHVDVRFDNRIYVRPAPVQRDRRTKG